MSVGKGGALRAAAAKNLLSGAKPLGAPTVRTVAPAATPPTDVERSTQRVQEATARSPLEGARALEEEARNLNDPAKVDALIDAVQPELARISQDLATRVVENHDDSDENPVTRGSLEALAHVADLAGPDGADAIAQELAVGLRGRISPDGNQDLNQFDDVLRDLADEGRGVVLSSLVAQKTLREQGLGGVGNELLDVATKGLEKLNEKFSEAQATYSEHEQRLASDLAGFGPGMTEEARQAYVEAFWNDPDHKPAKDGLDAASEALANGFAKTSKAIESTAAAGDDASAKVLLSTLENLAKSNTHADDALRYVGELNASTNTELINALEEHSGDDDLQTRLENNVVAPALSRAQGEAMAAVADGNPDALKDLEDLFKTFKTNGKNFQRLAGELGKLSDTLAQLRLDPTKFRVDKLVNGFNDKSPFGKAVAVFGVVSAIAAVGNDGPALDRIQAGLGAVRGGVQLGIGVLNTLARGTALAADAAKFGAKFLPGVGLAIDAIEFGQGINELTDDPNAGEFLKVLGSGISIVGDLAGLVPVLGTLPDALLTAVGAVVSGIGSIIDGFITGDQERRELSAEQRELLEAAGVPAADLDLLADYGPGWGKKIGALGLTREQVLAQFRDLEASNGTSNLGTAVSLDAAGLLGLQGQEALDFIEEFRRISDENPYAAEQLSSRMSNIGWRLLQLQTDEQNGFGNPEDRQRVLAEELELLSYNLGPYAELFTDAGFRDLQPDEINATVLLN